ncbi:MAG: DeoR/GlpR transcriptional regulator [Actinobacteria bacterium]|nr:DeoR/GlpR transcriptional regulator [Actinomycetota bacterium]
MVDAVKVIYPEDRRQKIIDLIKSSGGRMSIKELARHVRVSQSALYKDLAVLENRRSIKKSYGRLEFIDSEEKKHNFFLNLQKNAAQKKAIGKLAATLAEDNDTIFVDGSSTTFYFCEALKKRNLKNITLITNSIFVPGQMVMEDSTELICVGGRVTKSIGTSDGDIWELLVKNNFYANKFFFSCYSMSTEAGVLDPVQSDSSMKAVFALKSQKNICLVDSSKFSLYSTYNWIGMDSINMIITDSGLSKEVEKKLISRGVELMIAGKR